MSVESRKLKVLENGLKIELFMHLKKMKLKMKLDKNTLELLIQKENVLFVNLNMKAINQ